MDQGQRGLTSAKAQAQLERDGPNVSPRPKPVPWWRKLLAQLTHLFAIMLWVAAALAVLGGMPQLGAAICVVVIVNGVFAFVQEFRAEHAAEQLEALLPRRARVLRDGRTHELDAQLVVVGDWVLLEAGDRISADLQLTEARALAIDRSLLTGESVPVTASPGAAAHAGTWVVSGEGAGIVIATGSGTELSRIAQLTRTNHHPPTPLMLELRRLVHVLALIAVAIGATFFGVGLLVGLPPMDGFLFPIGVSVALVPEGLLPTVTLSLSVGARRMARHGALVRRLDAVETLGSTTFICTDKTGTLTENRMSVVEVWTPHGSAQLQGSGYQPTAHIRGDLERAQLQRVALAAARCSHGRVHLHAGDWQAVGDPMEAALHALALRAGVDLEADERARPTRTRIPFDATRRRMSVLLPDELVVKGAADSVLPLTAAGPHASEIVQQLGERGLRVLAIARRELAANADAEIADERMERDLQLLALVGFEDPPRAGAAPAIRACRQAGMRVGMITGDHPATARAIAREVGLGGEHVHEGPQLPADDGVLGALLDRDGVVVCHVTPEQKLRILTALQARGHVVAMTGDGVNDAPALQQADIGIAMGRSGTDVAREAADLVLLDDDFGTIVEAVRQGRATFSNIRRFLTYHLTDNVAELAPFLLWALSGGRVPLALSVLQILCLDLVTDQLPALALGAELPSPGVLSKPPHARRLLDGRMLMRALLVLGPVEALVSLCAFGAALWSAGWLPGTPVSQQTSTLAASGAAFGAVVLGQTVNAFVCRSETRAVWAIDRSVSALLWSAVALELALLVASLYVPAVARLLQHAPPSAASWGIASLALLLVPLADALFKQLTGTRVARSATG